MKAEHTPPTYWPLARVSAALSKRSGLVRSVSIRPQSLLMIAQFTNLFTYLFQRLLNKHITPFDLASGLSDSRLKMRVRLIGEDDISRVTIIGTNYYLYNDTIQKV